MERVAIFIDGSALLKGASSYKRKINIYKLQKLLVNNREHVRTYYYDGIFPEWVAEKSKVLKKSRNSKLKFVKELVMGKAIDYRLVDLRPREINRKEPVESWKWIQKGVDVLMATEILFFAFVNLYNTAVLVTGDGDFVAAVKKVKDMGKRIEIAYFEKLSDTQTSSALLEEADKIWWLNRYWPIIELR